MDFNPGLSGPTGKFPRGRMADDDEGEIRVALAVDRVLGTVVMDFGKPITWLGMTRDEALRFAAVLAAKAGEIPGG